MKKIRRPFFYLLAALCLLLTGVCTDESQAYSVLACEVQGSPEAAVFGSPARMFADRICTSELLGQRPAVEQVRSQAGFGSRCRMGLRRAAAVPDTVCCCLQPVCRVAERRPHRGQRSHAVTLHYIHEKDGQKP